MLIVTMSPIRDSSALVGYASTGTLNTFLFINMHVRVLLALQTYETIDHILLAFLIVQCL